MIKIAVTGPESSGKTTLCKSLSEHFKTPYITEFSRTYLEKKNGSYNQADLDKIAEGQLKLISNKEKKIMIYDSDFIFLSADADSKENTKEKQRNQVKSKFYYIFWGTATASVVLGQLYVGSGYRMFARSLNRIFDTVEVQVGGEYERFY